MTHLYVPLYSIWFQGVQRSIHTLCRSCSFLEVINININININIWDRLDKFGLLYNSFLVFSILSFDIQCQQWLRWFVMGEPFDDFRYEPLDCKITNSSAEMRPTPHANFWNNLNYVYTFDIMFFVLSFCKSCWHSMVFLLDQQHYFHRYHKYCYHLYFCHCDD